ncbi:hypothetical protein RR48_09324 [Papilio machaon]|uniref:Uncharacterized protein n=1 Tax=Papilio machaon TaxID=76193 RepID=A0A194RCH1_PAPMA|nr:hypothetical protein RR48_09324 [Papilio machaon]
MNQGKDLSTDVQSDITNMQKNYEHEDRIVFKDEEEMDQVEANSIDEPENNPVILPNDDFLQSSTYSKKDQSNRNSSDSSDNDLESRFGFDGGKCATGYIKVNGKCVAIMK